MPSPAITDRARRQIASTDSAEAFASARVMVKALADSFPEPDRIGLARAFCLRVVSAWWRALTEDKTDLREPPAEAQVGKLPAPAAASADSIGVAAAGIDPEHAAFAFGQIYTTMLPSSYRAAYGVYYTPPEIAARLIDNATQAGVDWTRCKVFDPACGGGAFLAPVAKRMLAALTDVEPAIVLSHLAHRLKGSEIDPFAAWLSQVTLDAVLLPVCRRARRMLPAVVAVADSLQDIPRGDLLDAQAHELFDLVIGNPPYGRITLSPSDRARFARSLHGHANLYGLFTDLALRYTRPGGVIAYVTPTSFLAGEYFKNLRALLGAEAPPVSIDLVTVRSGVFADVLQETLLATCRRGGRPARALISTVAPDGNGGLQVQKTGTFIAPEVPSQPWLLPRSRPQAHLIGRLRDMPHRLADWGYRVSTGPLVWNRFKPQLKSRPGRDRLPLIWAEAVAPDGSFVFRAEKKNHEPFFEIRDGDEWLVTRTPCVLLQRTTAKEQQRRLIAAALPAAFIREHGAVVIENHLNMVRAAVERPAVPIETLTAFLNSEAADQVFRCVSGSVAVSAYELESLSLPAPDRMHVLGALVRRQASREQIESACWQLYGGNKAHAA